MPKLPVLSGKDVIKALSGIGYYVDHQVGSHIILINERGHRVSVPNHYELDRGTLRSIIRQTGFTVNQFMELL